MDGTALTLEASAWTNKQGVVSGKLCSQNGDSYPIREGIPRFVLNPDADQRQTSDAFAFKWRQRDTYDSTSFRTMFANWSVEKYGFESFDDWAQYFATRQRILDVGCGSGLSSSLWLQSAAWTGDCGWVGADISEAIDVAQDRLSSVRGTHFVQADALHLPFAVESFDTVVSEGVFHHTPSTRGALLAAVRVLRRGGAFLFYVYRKKGAIREFTDDHIRERISSLSEEQAWDEMRSLARLGQALTEADVRLTVREDVPLLGIKAGTHDLQRLIYSHFAKLFWNPDLSFEENVHVNFDWYRPRYAHRQTAEEVRQWCDEGGLSVRWFHEEDSGFSVRAVRV